MTKNSNRKGLALGAIFALVSSLFVTAPAANANESGLVVQPIAGTSFTMVNTEDFVLSTRLGSLVQPGNVSALKYRIEKSGTVGYGLSISQTVSGTAEVAPLWSNVTAADTNTTSYMTPTSTVSTEVAFTPTTTVGLTNQLRIQLFTSSPNVINSASPATTVTVTAYLDLDGNGLINGTEPFTAVSISFVRTTAMGASVVLTQPIAGDTRITASAAITGVNHEQLGGTFNLVLAQTPGTSTTSASIAAATLAAGNYSVSHNITAATASATVAQSLSATLYYGASNNDENIVATSRLGVTSTSGFDGFTFSATVGNNLVYTGSSRNAADIRVNAPVSLEAWAFTGSAGAVSATQATKWWFSAAGLSTEKYLVVNGVTYTDSARVPTESTAISVALGTKGAIAIQSFGFTGGEVITLTQSLGDKSATMTLTARTPDFTLVSDTGAFAVVQPGANSAFTFTVKDQFDVLSSRTNQRVAAYSFAASRFSTSQTVSTPVAAGKATVTVSTLPATATGSATVRATLQRLDENTGTWTNVTSSDIALTVTTSAAIFTGRVTPTSSPVSISYDVHSWSGDVTVPANVAGAVVTVTATGLVIQDTATKVTASNTLVARAGSNGSLVLKFAGAKAGTYTVSYAVGTSTTTSQVVVQPAVRANASTVNFDKTTLVPGQTNTIVATLVDKNGNPIEIASGAGLGISYAGKGLPFNISGTMVTDEAGKATFQVLVLAGETGAGVITATIKRDGVTANDITVVRTLNIETPAAVVAPEINAVIGSFNGRWAVRVENAKGAVVSVKVGNRWVKYTSLNDNYLFSRQSRVGATLPVAVYVNGQLENVATITIK